MEISTVYTCQDTESECGIETGQCVVDKTHKCNRVVETEQWLSEDFHRQRCEAKARRDAKSVLQNSDCFGTKRMEYVE